MGFLNLGDVTRWLMTKYPDVTFYAGLIDKNVDKCIGVYSQFHGRQQPRAIGQDSSYGVKSISLLVHWGKSSIGCEEMALDVYQTLKETSTDETIGGYSCWVTPTREPVLLGRDDNGNFEAVIHFDIYFRRN